MTSELPALVNCGHCFWWVEDDAAHGDDRGACHRYPPRGAAPFPVTYRIAWCGEFQHTCPRLTEKV